MASKSEFLMSLNSQQKPLCQLVTTELFTKETKNRETARKWQKRVWVRCLRLVVLCLSNHADPYSSAWWSLTAQEKGIFQDPKELKINYMVAIFQERLSTLSIRCIKSDKLSQKIVMNCWMILLWGRPGQKRFNCLLCCVQPYLIRWLRLFIS